MRQRSESKYNLGYTGLTTGAQNTARLLSHAECLQRPYGTTVPPKNMLWRGKVKNVYVATASLGLFGMNLNARALLPTTAVDIIEAMLKCGPHSWRIRQPVVLGNEVARSLYWISDAWMQEGLGESEEVHNESNTILASLRVEWEDIVCLRVNFSRSYIILLWRLKKKNLILIKLLDEWFSDLAAH